MSYIFSSTVSKNLTIDFIFAKNVLLRCAFLFKKRQMSFGKNRNLSNDLIYYYSSQSLPKISFINPDFFTQIIHSSQHRIVDNIDNLDTSWIVIPWSITNSMETSKIKTGSIITNLKAEDPQESRRHH